MMKSSDQKNSSKSRVIMPNKVGISSQPSIKDILNNRHPYNDLFQRKITYKSGPYHSNDELEKALVSIFGSGAITRIKALIKRYEDLDEQFGPKQALESICADLKEEGFIDSTVIIDHFRDDKHHGPILPHGTLPFREDREKPEDKTIEQVLSTMGTGSATLSNFTLLSGGDRLLSVHSKQKDSDSHAEELIIPALTEGICKLSINTKAATLNITINNFFCKRCLPQIISLKEKYQFQRVHVYFIKSYGDMERMKAAIQLLQENDILVSRFEITPDTHSFAMPGLDEHSESGDSDDDTDSDTDYFNEHLEQDYQDADKTTVSFTVWMDMIDNLLESQFGVGSEDIPDEDYRGNYEEGINVADFYDEYFAHKDFPL